jgi:hypothetical protein
LSVPSLGHDGFVCTDLSPEVSPPGRKVLARRDSPGSVFRRFTGDGFPDFTTNGVKPSELETKSAKESDHGAEDGISNNARAQASGLCLSVVPLINP